MLDLRPGGPIRWFPLLSPLSTDLPSLRHGRTAPASVGLVLPHMHARQASWGRDWGRKQVVEVMAAAQVRDDEHKHRSLDLDILLQSRSRSTCGLAQGL